MTLKTNPSSEAIPEIDLSEYGISEGAGIEFSITMKNSSEPDRVHVVYARDRQPGPDWVHFQFKFTQGNIPFKTLFVHKDELPYCELYKNAQNASAQKTKASKNSESIYFHESTRTMEFLQMNRSEILKRMAERMMPEIGKLLNEMKKNNGEFLEMRMFESSRRMHHNMEFLLEGAQRMLKN